MPSTFPSQFAADKAIRAYILSGKAKSGHSSINFSGPGGSTVWSAHVSRDGTSWCL